MCYNHTAVLPKLMGVFNFSYYIIFSYLMSVRVHRCRFLNYERPNITAMAFNYASTERTPSDLRLSVCRSNGDIEIWNPFTLIPELVIPGAQGRTIEDVCWVKNGGEDAVHRLFTVGGTDTLTEWSLETQLPINFIRSDAGIIWAIEPSFNSSKVALVTELGVVVVLDSESMEVLYRLKSGDTSSLTSLCWISEDLLACGGVDGTIQVWSLGSKQIVGRMSVGAAAGNAGNDDLVVWALKYLPRSKQLVSADSNGFLKFWDAKTWLLQQSLKAHEGDVLCLATSLDGRSLFSAGLDQKIVHTQQLDKQSKHRWTLMGSKVAHTNDIRCMASFEDGNQPSTPIGSVSLLVSGGLDDGIVVDTISAFSLPSKRLSSARLRPHSECVNNFVLDWNEQQLKLWNIPKPKSSNQSPTLKAVIKLANEEFITSASFDPDSELLAVSTLFALKLYTVSDNVTPFSLFTEIEGAKIVKFVSSEKLVVVTEDDKLLLLDVRNELLTQLGDYGDAENDLVNRTVSLPYLNTISMVASSHGQKDSRLAVIRHNGSIEIFDLDTLEYSGKLPQASQSLPAAGFKSVTAAAFRNNDFLIVAYADKSVLEFDTRTCTLTQWSKLNMSRMPTILLSQTEPAYGIFTNTNPNDENGSNRAWLWGPNWLATIDFGCKVPLRKRGKNDSVEFDESEQPSGATVTTDDLPHFSLTTKYRQMFFAANLGSHILISERPQNHKQQAHLKPFWSFRRIQL